jgi:DNA mismatch endonuclease (patch repair protein)
MARVRSADTRPERRLASALRRLRLRFRRQGRSLPGRPDFILVDHRAVIFVHGCFWHNHGCRPERRHAPRTNPGYWSAKLARNQARDRRVARQLRAAGWTVFTVWECRVDAPATLARIARRLGLSRLPPE